MSFTNKKQFGFASEDEKKAYHNEAKALDKEFVEKTADLIEAKSKAMKEDPETAEEIRAKILVTRADFNNKHHDLKSKYSK